MIEQRTRDGISQRQLEYAVALFRHDTGHGFFQEPDGGFVLHENGDQKNHLRCCEIGLGVV